MLPTMEIQEWDWAVTHNITPGARPHPPVHGRRQWLPARVFV